LAGQLSTNEKPGYLGESITVVPNLYFLRQVKKSGSKPGQGCINLLMKKYPCQLNGLTSLLSLNGILKIKRLTVFKEQDKQQKPFMKKLFLLTKIRKINLN